VKITSFIQGAFLFLSSTCSCFRFLPLGCFSDSDASGSGEECREEGGEGDGVNPMKFALETIGFEMEGPAIADIVNFSWTIIVNQRNHRADQRSLTLFEANINVTRGAV
jgi:hypothetical protein